ncbi:hypothetical protein FB451DRAFT_1557011 [Mycena latifolia]|nr:hypothetical protein FB451DRAFT_1557011 [Mycena latifolia]
MVALVQDLIDTIIDELAVKQWFEPKDYATLTACSLAARALVAPSQRHLFRSLTLSDKKLDEKEWRVLTDSPHLASYVRDLFIDNGFGATSPIYAPLASELLPLLGGVNRLAFRSGRWSGDEGPDSFHATALPLFSLPSLRCVGLMFCDGVPASFIRHALVSYEEVSLNYVSILPDDEVFRCDELARHALPSVTSLDHLAISAYSREGADTCRDLLLGNGIASSWEHVRHLELSLPLNGSLGAFEHIPLKCSNIQHLTIAFNKRHDDPITLPTLPQLRVLTLKAEVRKLRVPWSVFTSIASLPTCMPAVEILNFDIRAEFEEPRDHYHRPEVDEALRSLPALKKVHFRVACSRQDHFEPCTRRKLPLANDANLLKFSVIDRNERYHPMAVFSN